MEGLTGYGSDYSDSSTGGTDVPGVPAAAPGSAAANASASDDSYFGNTDSGSEDSAVVRRKAAEARLRDYGEEATSSGAGLSEPPAGRAAANGGLLPSAGDVLGQVAGPPSFLDPEATRPVARAIHRGRPPGEAPSAAPEPGEKRAASWDVSHMAPKLKGEVKAPTGVITAAAKRSRAEEGPMVTAAQIALMGGQWRPNADDEVEDASPAAPGAARPGAAAADKPHGVKRAVTKPMGVSEFLDRGIGGALLPRNRADRKEKEKEKRGKGQSTASHWKSEAEMVLRQQYDS